MPAASCAHLISSDAIEAAMEDGKLKALDNMSLKDVRVFKVMDAPGKHAAELYELTQGEKIKYASHFCNIREPPTRDAFAHWKMAKSCTGISHTTRSQTTSLAMRSCTRFFTRVWMQW